ncbi:MAG: hypothetical protein HY360_26965 [Verrucomicrobia bacterium]|nr:hypothetical protein [Verrucomicrobiota bacterium]
MGVGVFESVGPSLRHYGYETTPVPNRNTIEIFFASWNDQLGWFQFCFNPDGSVQTFNHLPYPQAHSTAFEYLRHRKFRWEMDMESPSSRLYWLFAWFPIKQVFRHGPVCGFNITRNCPPIEEASSWNHTAAVGFQDATTFGSLTLRELKRIEPEPFFIRLPTRKQARDFRFSVTYDIPDNIAYTNYYTPRRLERELATWKSWGIRRIYWIEYGPLSRWPSFWKMMIGSRNRFADLVELTRRHCDDTLFWAAKSAKRLGLEIIAVYKPFDLGFNTEWTEDDGVSAVKEMEDHYVSAHPDVVSHQDCTMRAHPAWSQPAKFPITRLCLYSETPFYESDNSLLRSSQENCAFAKDGLVLWISKDNRRFERYRKPFRIATGPVRRPHFRWTPAGKVGEPGSARNHLKGMVNHLPGVVNHIPGVVNWRIELLKLEIHAPFMAIEIRGKTFAMRHRRFAFVEAWGADGRESPVSLATGGNRVKGFRFDKTWLGWVNHTEPILDEFTWSGAELGLVFKETEQAPTLLEPAYEGARRIWLAHVQRMLEAGVDGVEIRTIGHHNCVDSYLRLAFAEPVRRAFRERYGRDVEPKPDDYERIRGIRGEAYTQFMRDAKALAKRHGKKLSAHIEGGAEVPPHLDTRLQMQMSVEWEKWIRERIVDEVSLRGWMCHNPFVHRHLMPLARRMKVPVHIISKNLPGGIDLRAMELCERFVTEACAAGFSGFSLYESDSLLRMNSQGIPMSVGNTEQAVRHAANCLRRCFRN